MQPSKRALPTLLPEGLGKEVHLQLALQMKHPFTLQPPLSEHCEYAVKGQYHLGQRLGVTRHKVCALTLELKELLKEDTLRVKDLCHPWLVSVLQSRNIPFMRELSWCCIAPDFCFLPHYVLPVSIVFCLKPSCPRKARLSRAHQLRPCLDVAERLPRR